MNDNVIKFPKSKIEDENDGQVPTVQEVKDKIGENKQKNIDEITAILQQEMIGLLKEAGFSSDTFDKTMPSLCFLIEALRSYIASCYNVEHCLQTFAENVFEIEKDTGCIFFIQPKFNVVEKIPLEETTEEK